MCQTTTFLPAVPAEQKGVRAQWRYLKGTVFLIKEIERSWEPHRVILEVSLSKVDNPGGSAPMNTSKKRFLTEQVRRLRGRFAQSVDTLLGEVMPGELLEQWVLEEVVQWRERLNRQVMCRLR